MDPASAPPFLLLRHEPHPALAPFLREMVGFEEWHGAAWVRRELPGAFLPLILVLGEGFTLHGETTGPGAAPVERELRRSFLAGPGLKPASVGSRGRASCLQVNFTLAGARRFLGLDMAALEDRIEDLEDLLGEAARGLEARLAEIPDWPGRFALVESFLLERLAGSRPAHPTVQAGLAALGRAGGRLSIGKLTRDLGVSRKQLNRLFRREVGLSAKATARLLRFERVQSRLASGGFDSLTSLAHDSGFADQAHFNREFRDLAGESPGAYLQRAQAEATGPLFV